MYTEKFRLKLKIFILILLIVLLIATPISMLNYSKTLPLIVESPNECLKKGNICTSDEIYKGVEVIIKVSNNKEYKFNMISNNQETMTLQLKENIIPKTDWHGELINIKGPQIAIESLYNATKSWDKISAIESYEYKDSGKIIYEKRCSNNTQEKDYDCTTTSHPTRGYNSISINNGLATIYTNIAKVEGLEDINNEYKFTDYKLKARLITREEIKELEKNDAYPTWLISNLKQNEGYWTLTSATSVKGGYSQGAVAITNKNNSLSIDDLSVMHSFIEKHTIGIRPVITISK